MFPNYATRYYSISDVKHVRLQDKPTFDVVASLLIVITIAAGALPALRATKLDPLRALQE